MPTEDIKKRAPEDTERALVELAIEGWRFQKLFARALEKLDIGESSRLTNQHRYFLKRIDECLIEVGLRLVNLEGQAYDPGAAATALNLGDFNADDQLVIDQMIEPIVMSPSGLLRTGTVILRRAEQ
jgi:hypothetical protein